MARVTLPRKTAAVQVHNDIIAEIDAAIETEIEEAQAALDRAGRLKKKRKAQAEARETQIEALGLTSVRKELAIPRARRIPELT